MSNVTMREVAHAAGVHPSTVSRALDPEKSRLVTEATRLRIEKVAAELGYRPDRVASSLRRGRTKTFGVVVADLGNPYIAPVLRGIENNLDSRGVMVLVAETQDDRHRFHRVMDHLVNRRVDAIVTTAARHGDGKALKIFDQAVPIVLAVRRLADADFPTVTHDDERGGQAALTHLADLGHRRVLQLRGPTDISSFVDRARGFESEAERVGIVLAEDIECASHPTLAEGHRLMSKVLAAGGELPTAVFAGNDSMAVGALQAMAEKGLHCPDDIAVIGYNNTPMTEFTNPPLSTIGLPGYELGRLAADVAVMLLEDPSRRIEQPLTLPPTLLPRASTLGTTSTIAVQEEPSSDEPR